MSKKIEKELERLILEKSITPEQIGQIMGAMAKNIAGLTDFSKLTLALAVVEKSSSAVSSFQQMKTQPLSGIFSELKEELPDILFAHISLLRFLSFCKWGFISSLVFAICGIYLVFIGSLPIELGAPLIVLFALSSFIFSTKLLSLETVR